MLKEVIYHKIITRTAAIRPTVNPIPPATNPYTNPLYFVPNHNIVPDQHKQISIPFPSHASPETHIKEGWKSKNQRDLQGYTQVRDMNIPPPLPPSNPSKATLGSISSCRAIGCFKACINTLYSLDACAGSHFRDLEMLGGEALVCESRLYHWLVRAGPS